MKIIAFQNGSALGDYLSCFFGQKSAQAVYLLGQRLRISKSLMSYLDSNVLDRKSTSSPLADKALRIARMYLKKIMYIS
ncbi:hypothetical protein ABPG73_013916 [Tetrahymena malaccensis]